MKTEPGNEDADLDRTDELPVLADDSVGGADQDDVASTGRHRRATNAAAASTAADITVEMERISDHDLPRLENDVEKLKARWSRIEAMLGEGSGSLEALETELGELRRALADSLTAEQELRAELAKREAAESDLDERFRNAQTEARDQARKAAELADRVDELNAAVESARRDATEQSTALEQERKRIRALEAELERALADAAGLGETNAGLAASVAELTADRDRAVAAMEEARSAANSTARGDAELLARIAELEAYIAGRGDRWKEMEAIVAEQSARIRELEHELRYRVGEQDALARRLAAAQTEADTYRRQATFALTAAAAAATETADAAATAAIDLRAATVRDAANEADRHSIGDMATVREPSPAESKRAGQGADEAGGESPVSTDAGGERLPAVRATLVGLTSDAAPRHDIVADRTTIGREANCDICIPTHFVSRLHAVLRREAGRVLIEDQNSTNGVFVNSVRVSEAVLRDGDWVTIGETLFRYVVDREPPQ